jgi:hypothetical protein
LINGHPINGVLGRLPPVVNCNFVQPCPILIGYNGRNLLDIPAGIQLGNLLLSAHGNGQIDSDENVGDGSGTYVRVTGALVMDCGHAEVSDSRPCYDHTSDPDDVSSHSNQEIHPIYSIDVIKSPYRPEDTRREREISPAPTVGVMAARTTCGKPAAALTFTNPAAPFGGWV